MPNLRNGSKGGFEPRLTRLRVRHSTAELLRSNCCETKGTTNVSDGHRDLKLFSATQDCSFALASHII